MIYVYELEENRRIAFPDLSPEAVAAYKRVVSHLLRIEPIVGQFTWNPDARAFFEDWYSKLSLPADIIMRGFYRSKDTQLLKVAMLLGLCEDPPSRVITLQNLQVGLAMFDRIEPNMGRLSHGTGRNELAGPTMKLLELLEKNGGEMPEKKLQAVMYAHMYIHEYPRVLEHLRLTEQIAPKYRRLQSGIEREMVALMSFFEGLTKKAKQQTENKPPL